jgi:uncharacterized protein YnzC (UPF0291/DUF896 family)
MSANRYEYEDELIRRARESGLTTSELRQFDEDCAQQAYTDSLKARIKELEAEVKAADHHDSTPQTTD